MNDTLKVAGRIGAELGAAKAENEAMRILLRESYSELLVMKTEVGFRGKTLELIDRIDAFLSRQPEPTDTYTAVDMATAAAQAFRDGQAAVEPAQAQDELPAGGVTIEKDIFGTVHIKMGDFDYIQIQYQYPYTDNARQNVLAKRIAELLTRPAQTAPQGKFRMGDLVKKSTGSEWVGHVCGTYSTALTPEGYAVESEAHAGSVQIYPVTALEAVE